MKLYHYSNQPNLQFIDTKFDGSNGYTKSDTFHQLSYFYPTREAKEKFFDSASYRYSVEIPPEKLYHTYSDNDGWFASLSTNGLITKLKEHGYLGLVFIQPSGLTVVVLFYPQKIIEKEIL